MLLILLLVRYGAQVETRRFHNRRKDRGANACTCGSQSIRFSEPFMFPDVSIPTSLSLRAFVVIAALVCLCVSSNVGLQFFPLPALTSDVKLHVQQNEANRASQAPRADSQSSRVPMMVQSNKRADQEPPQSNNPPVALRINQFDVSGATRFAIEIDYPVCFLTSVPMTPHAGRAPPSLA